MDHDDDEPTIPTLSSLETLSHDGPGFRRRKRQMQGMGTIRFLLLMMSVCVLVGTAANFLREPTYNLIDENFGLHLHPAPDGPPPPTPGPMIMN